MDDLSDHPSMINSLIFVMATISNQARTSLETEEYRFTALPDEVTPQYVLEDAFKNMMVDLETIGLSFDIDMSDYVDDFYKLSKFLDFVSLLLPNTLYDFIKTDSKLRTVISNIVNGSLGDGGTFIQVYISELAGLDGSLALRPELTDFLDQLYLQVTQTEVFSDYLKNMIQLYNDQRPSDITDAERHIQYRDVLKEKLGMFFDASSLFEGYDYYEELYKIRQVFVKDLLSPDNFIEYSYLFLENPTTIPDDLIPGYHQKWYHYKVSHRWCYDYYTVRDIEPTLAEQIAIACFEYMMNSTDINAYKTNMSVFRRQYPDMYKIDEKIGSLYQEVSHG